jgi:hypothetical protein
MKRFIFSVFLCFACSNSYADIATGLVGWWKMNQSSGTTVLDSSGSANLLTFNTSPTWVAGHIGNYAAGLNGTNQYGSTTTVTNIPAINASQTLSAWVNTSSAAVVEDIIVNENSGSAVGSQLRIDDGVAQVSKWGGGTTITGGAVSVNTWHMITWTYNSTGTASVIYIDGAQSATAAVASQTGASAAVFVGAYAAGAGDENFVGDIDDVRIYNRALAAADVAQLYDYYTGRNGLFTLLSR